MRNYCSSWWGYSTITLIITGHLWCQLSRLYSKMYSFRVFALRLIQYYNLYLYYCSRNECYAYGFNYQATSFRKHWRYYNIIYFSYYHCYILCFFYICSRDYAFYYFRNNRNNFAHLFNGSSTQPLGLCA